MTKLVIKFQSNNPKVSVKINDHDCDDISVTESEIVIDHQLLFGFHKLAITVDTAIKILDVIVDGVSVKNTLFLGYSDNGLTTEIQSGTWYLPFGNPVSEWIANCAKKIPNGSYGTDLYQNYEIFYPDSIRLDQKYPKILRDFFEYNFDFHLYKKTTNPLHAVDVPYVGLNLPYNETALLNEFTKNLHLIEQHAYKPKQVQPGQPKPWQVAMVIYPGSTTPTVDEKQFPEFFKLLRSIDGIEIGWVFIGALVSGSYVLPHVDDLYAYESSVKDCYGCCQIYIPIGWKPGNYFKFHNTGLVPYDQGAILANTTNFSHASVNDSDSIRYTIGIICKFKNTEFLKYVN